MSVFGAAGAGERAPAKICGLTRLEDAALAVRLGAAALGVVLAESPRRVDVDQAARVLDVAPRGVARVGVFVDATTDEVLRAVDRCRLDWAQLCGREPDEQVAALRARGVRVLRVHRPIRADQAGAAARRDLTDAPVDDTTRIGGAVPHRADALLLDAPGGAGGTGRTFDWSLAAAVDWPRDRLVLAGGLDADNVLRAIAAVRPAAVDVSSGVESAPGIKDPARMASFLAAVRVAYESIEVDL